MRRRREPDEYEWATALRLAGYSLAAISAQTGIPPRTLSRHFGGAAVRRGSARRALTRKALSKLLNEDLDAESIKTAVATQLADDIALGRAMRDKLAEAIASLDPASHEAALDTCRAMASAATAFRNTQFVFHTGIGADALEAQRAAQDTPALIIYEMTAEEIREVRERQQAERARSGGGEDLAD